MAAQLKILFKHPRLSV